MNDWQDQYIPDDNDCPFCGIVRGLLISGVLWAVIIGAVIWWLI